MLRIACDLIVFYAAPLKENDRLMKCKRVNEDDTQYIIMVNYQLRTKSSSGNMQLRVGSLKGMPVSDIITKKKFMIRHHNICF